VPSPVPHVADSGAVVYGAAQLSLTVELSDATTTTWVRLQALANDVVSVYFPGFRWSTAFPPWSMGAVNLLPSDATASTSYPDSGPRKVRQWPCASA